MGNREAISKMNKISAAVLTSVLTLIDEYDLYGQVAYPKHHKHSEVPDIYRLAARTKVYCFIEKIYGAVFFLLLNAKNLKCLSLISINFDFFPRSTHDVYSSHLPCLSGIDRYTFSCYIHVNSDIIC